MRPGQAVVGFLTGACLFGLDPDLRNPRTGRRPAVLHAPGGLNLNPVCQKLSLPLGRRRNRVRWYLGNFRAEVVAVLLLLLLLTVVLVTLTAAAKRGRVS